MGKLFLFGDSITAGANCARGGWAPRLIGDILTLNVQADEAQSEFWCMPYNMGVIGNTIPDVLKRMPSEIAARRDDNEVIQIVFAIGANDSVWMVQDNRPRFTDDEFQHNLRQLIDTARTTTPHISFIGITPADDVRVNPCPWAPQFGCRTERRVHFEKMIADVCALESMPFLPVSQAFQSLSDYVTYLQDGVHPTTQGHECLYNLIKPFLLTSVFMDIHTGC